MIAVTPAVVVTADRIAAAVIVAVGVAVGVAGVVAVGVTGVVAVGVRRGGGRICIVAVGVIVVDAAVVVVGILAVIAVGVCVAAVSVVAVVAVVVDQRAIDAAIHVVRERRGIGDRYRRRRIRRRRPLARETLRRGGQRAIGRGLDFVAATLGGAAVFRNV